MTTLNIHKKLSIKGRKYALNKDFKRVFGDFKLFNNVIYNKVKDSV